MSSVSGDGYGSGGGTTVSVNSAPSGTDTTVTTPQNYLLRKSNFGFSDVDGNAFLAVKITTPPLAGALYCDSNGRATAHSRLS